MSNFNYDKYKVTFNYRRKRKYLLIFFILVVYLPMNFTKYVFLYLLKQLLFNICRAQNKQQ